MSDDEPTIKTTCKDDHELICVSWPSIPFMAMVRTEIKMDNVIKLKPPVKAFTPSTPTIEVIPDKPVNQPIKSVTKSKDNIEPIRNGDDPDRILQQAVGEFQDVLIMGYDKNGKLDVRSSSLFGENAPEILWIMELIKKKLINGDYAND